MKVLIGSKNKHKVSELMAILKDLPVTLLSLADLPECAEPIEDGSTFYDNALIKAKYYFAKYHLPTICDDTGLCVAALKGAPGVVSARYSGGDDACNRNLLLKNLALKLPTAAYFETSMVFYDGDKIISASGILDGMIISKPAGENGFGYDSLFYLPTYKMTLAEVATSVKNQISHRYLASISLASKLTNYFTEKAVETTIVTSVARIYPNSNIKLGERFLAGMSNYTYQIKIDDQKYVVRLPGENADCFVNRSNEEKNSLILSHALKRPLYERFNLKTGLKLSTYIEGTPMDVITDKNSYIDEIVTRLKELHSLGPIACNDYNPFELLNHYEQLVKDLPCEVTSEYQIIKERLLAYQDLLTSRSKTICHCDSQLSNYILTPNHDVYLLDYEFVGNNDFLYDIACFGNNGLDFAMAVLAVYQNNHETKEEQRIVELWHAFQSLQWYNVALFKAHTGMSEKLNINFSDVAIFFLNKAKQILK